MNHLLFFISALWLSFIAAKFEITIEGKDGWAGKLPTWRLSKNHWISRIFFGGRPATGYHVWANIFLISFFHSIFLFVSFNVFLELKLLSFLMIVGVMEDFLWFVLNPDFGLKNFKKEKIWWHKDNWWAVAPREYFIFLPLGIILYLIAVGII